jgi:NAD(P)-dependent dehydrogenase (short-subunit alcohol dehydrogenase family)
MPKKTGYLFRKISRVSCDTHYHSENKKGDRSRPWFIRSLANYLVSGLGQFGQTAGFSLSSSFLSHLPQWLSKLMLSFAGAGSLLGQVGQVAYGSLKAGVVGLVLPMARDLMDLGIRVNAILPGIFDTPLLARVPEKVRAGLNASVPFPKRLGLPEEFASLAMELVRNSYFNAQAIRLDGGIRMAPR